jgi:hypothetical protein
MSSTILTGERGRKPFPINRNLLKNKLYLRFIAFCTGIALPKITAGPFTWQRETECLPPPLCSAFSNGADSRFSGAESNVDRGLSGGCPGKSFPGAHVVNAKTNADKSRTPVPADIVPPGEAPPTGDLPRPQCRSDCVAAVFILITSFPACNLLSFMPAGFAGPAGFSMENSCGLGMRGR